VTSLRSGFGELQEEASVDRVHLARVAVRACGDDSVIGWRGRLRRMQVKHVKGLVFTAPVARGAMCSGGVLR
jgi:hypothetical protein